MSDNRIIQQILDATDGGLNIILSLYPDAAKCIDNNRHFKLRDEKNASATVKKMNNGQYWVKDFGGDFSGGAIQLFMYKEGYDIKEAIKELIARYSITGNAPTDTVHKPDRSERPAGELEEEGMFHPEIHTDPTEEDLKGVFATHVINHAFHVYKDNWKKHLVDTMKEYSFYVLKSYSFVKDRLYKTVTATDKYPIYAITGDGFTKIIQPKSFDKKFRFRYFGKKADKDYVFGYARLCKRFAEGEKKWEEENAIDEEQQEGSKKKKVKPFKLQPVVICCGERDSLNVAALSKNVIWGNSESAVISFEKFIQLSKMCSDVFYLGDLDVTGRKQAHATQLRHLEIKGIQLPMDLLEKKDWRGNPCKDVRDFFEHYPAKRFEQLQEEALPYKFWDEEPQFNREGVFKKNIYNFNNVYAYNFIQKCGFFKYKSKAAKDGYEYIHINKNVVTIIDPKEIKAFINDFLKQRKAKEVGLRNAFYRSNQLGEESLNNLTFVELDFKYFGKDFQYMFFLNEAWKITSEGITVHDPEKVDKMVWSDKVVQHRVKLLPPPFEIVPVKKDGVTTGFDILIHNMDCLFFRYLINSSRVHWRDELETRLDESTEHNTIEKKGQYLKDNKFNIAGPLLSEFEKEEQKLHLINKIYTLGYILHRFKDPSKAWAPYIMDHKLSTEGESHGGSGKSIFAAAPSRFLNTLVIDGKNKHLQDDKHAWENVTEQTEYVYIDDLSRYTEVEPFFAKITGSLTVNPKFNQRFVLDFPDSPKIGFTTNYGVRNNNPSTERRLLYSSFSDYYHPNLADTYREERKPTDDFGKTLFDEFTREEWNMFNNTMAYCLHWYLKIDHKVQPPMNNVIKRNLQGIMGTGFQDWADVYFSPESNRLDTMIPRQIAFADFIKVGNIKNFSPHKFFTCMSAWCQFNDYQFNPDELKNNGGRIIRKDYKRNLDGSLSSTKEAMEMVYVKTKKDLDPSLFDDINVTPVTPSTPSATTMPAGKDLTANEDDDDLPF